MTVVALLEGIRGVRFERIAAFASEGGMIQIFDADSCAITIAFSPAKEFSYPHPYAMVRYLRAGEQDSTTIYLSHDELVDVYVAITKNMKEKRNGGIIG